MDRNARGAAPRDADRHSVVTDAVDSEKAPSGGLFETAADPEALDRAVAAAAPVAVERADLAMVNSLEPSLREPVFGLLSSLADNKYLLGRRYAEWCTGAPMLESAVAAAAMAQDELGHARSFYPLLRGFPHGLDATQMEEKGWQERPTSAMTCLGQPFSTWFDFLAANLVVDTALTTLLSAAVDSSYEPLRQRARKIQQEEAGHWVHGVGWLRRLQSNDAELSSALARVWDDAFTWFGQSDDPVLTPLVAATILNQTPDDLRATLRNRLEPLLSPTAGSLFIPQLPWHRWDPVARQLSP
jgi:1,2-phenylacetyl-CoA epoxidase catalytic subunit